MDTLVENICKSLVAIWINLEYPMGEKYIMNPLDPNHQLFIGLANLTAAIANIRLYSKEHPQVLQYVKRAYDSIKKDLESSAELNFTLIGEEIIVNNVPLKVKSPHLTQFQRIMKENEIERISFKKGLTYVELEQFINEIASPAAKTIKSHPAIRLGQVQLNNHASVHANAPVSAQRQNSDQLETLSRLQQLPLENLQEIYFSIKKEKEVNVMGIDGIVKSFLKGFSHGLKPLQMLASLKNADQYTFTHVVNVCLLTMAQAERLGISGHKLYEVGIAAVLHDVGKLFVPDEILNKPGALTKDERKIIEAHSISGAQYILRLANVPKLAILGALEHHIRYDGSGYPFINSHWRPHLISQMIAIADIYDAMRSRRPYQDPRPEKLILNILKKEKGTSFNPYLVDSFLALLRGFPQVSPNHAPAIPPQSHLDRKHILQTSGS